MGWPLILIMLFSSVYSKDFYRHGYFFLSIFLIGYFAIKLDLPKCFKALFFIATTGAAYGIWNEGRIWQDLSFMANKKLEASAAESGLLILLCYIFFEYYKDLKKTVDLFVIAESIVIIFSKLFFGEFITITGSFGISTLIISAWAPMIFTRYDKVLTLPLIVSILMTGLTTPFIGYAILGGIWILKKVPLNIKCALIFLTTITAILICQNFDMNDGNRFLYWRVFIIHFVENMDILKGIGIGNFWHIGPSIQHQYFPKTTKLFSHAHNEFIQVFMELGIFGLLLFVWCCVDVLKKSYKNKALFTVCFMTIFSFFTWNIIRYAPGMIFTVILLGEVYATNNSNYEGKIFQNS